MKCSICGAKLKKAGDLCSNCYKEFQEEEELKKDVNEIFKMKRKYSIKYEMWKYVEIIALFAFCMIVLLITGQILAFFGALLFLLVALGVLLFIDKRLAMGTSVTFYEKKIVYRFKFAIFNKTKVVKYTDLKDVAYYQTFRQKKMGMGDFCFYAKGAIPGATLLNGFQIKDIEDAAGTIEKIREIIN